MHILYSALRFCTLLWVMASLSNCQLHAQANDSFPNILLIIADDMGVDVTPGYFQNNLMPTTPTLDSLRSVGLTFTQAWATPQCTPTRASLMSGKFGVKTGVMRAPGNLDLVHTSVFNNIENSTQNRYTDAVIGKWHISSGPVDFLHPQQHGLDYYMGFINASPTAYDRWDRIENGVERIDSTYITSTLTTASIDWIGNQTQPWFLWLAHAAPHSPLHVPPADLFTISPTGSNYRQYLAMIESIDHETNRLLQALPDSVRDNTLVIFIGDNGTPGNLIQQYPAGQAKGTVYEGGIRVPMIVAGKGVTRKGERESALVHTLDIHATILEMTGQTLPGGLFNSLSFAHLLDNSPGPKRLYNYSDYQDDTLQMWAIREARYKLIEDANGLQQMFDLSVDSLEFNDLLLGTLTTNQLAIKTDLEAEALQIRTAWSCRDFIQNGDETGIDCGGSLCQPCAPNSLGELQNQFPIQLYPNPAKHALVLTAEQAYIQGIHITDLTGRIHFQQKELNSSKQQIDVSALTSQVYILKVSTTQGVFYKKFIRE